MALNVLPDGWTPQKLQAFNDVVDAATAYNTYANALAALGVNNATLNQDRTDVANLIKNVLGPRLIAQG